MTNFYIRHALLPFSEDSVHEFKAHRCFSKRDLSDLTHTFNRDGECKKLKVKYNRTPLSKHICGMLNTGKGGTFYLGVTDQGRVEGFMMSIYQKDHVTLALWHLLQAFSPPVPKHMYNLRFVPVLDSVDERIDVQKEDNVINGMRRELAHELNESRYCWCDCYTTAMLERGVMHRFYVVEIEFKAWDPLDARNKGLVFPEVPSMNPIFQNEEGKCYLRRNGGTTKMDLELFKERTMYMLRQGVRCKVKRV